MADKLTPKQHAAISALLIKPTFKAAADAAGCTDRALRGWLDEPQFAAAYQQARRAAVGQAIARLLQLSAAAADELGKLVSRFGGVKPEIRLAAARTILEMAIESVELEDLQSRVAALEDAHAKQS